MQKDDSDQGGLLSADEKTIWRHTYSLLKDTSMEEWSNIDSRELRDWVNLCLGKLIYRQNKRNMTLRACCEQIEREERGSLAGMATFLKTY